ncbi:MAG: hypothetical protein ACRC9Q_04495 [Bacteroidales bacterium]
MKKIILNPVFLVLLFISTLMSCSKDAIMYEGGEYAMFADSMAYVPVTPDAESVFEFPVSLTKAQAKDKTYGIEVVIKKSNAIEGVHYELLTQNVTIKAGETKASVKLKGLYDNIVYGEHLQISLKLLAPKEEVWGIYGQEARLLLIKCPDFSIDKFVGNVRFYAAFPFADRMTSFLATTQEFDGNTLLLKNTFSNKRDLRIDFVSNENDPFENSVVVKEQFVLIDPYYGEVLARTVDSNPSYYITEARSVFLNLELFVPGVGSFGVHPYVIRWITQAEADAENNSTGTPMSLKPKYLINAFTNQAN